VDVGQPKTHATLLSPEELQNLYSIERRLLWLATSIVHNANRVRPNFSGIKVGGHQASSASMVSIMTALWFAFLEGQDRVSVKPHASPVLHAINYLLGNLSKSYMTRLRSYGGIQSYPSRVKDPDPVDYSTDLGSHLPKIRLLSVRCKRWRTSDRSHRRRRARRRRVLGSDSRSHRLQSGRGYVGG
jgi:pyruvate dehydrogenase E1 component